MNDDAASLNRLHDIVLPAPVPWWPLAPGWYIAAIVVVIAATWFAVKCWHRWQSNAFRREALSALRGAGDAAEIATLLRRTALVVAPREEVSGLVGDAWVDWLAARSASSITSEVRAQLARGPYSPAATGEVTALREWASHWIATVPASPRSV